MTTPKMRETPRVDAKSFSLAFYDGVYVEADFARQLERENQELANSFLKLAGEVRANLPPGHMVKRWIEDAEAAARAALGEG